MRKEKKMITTCSTRDFYYLWKWFKNQHVLFCLDNRLTLPEELMFSIMKLKEEIMYFEKNVEKEGGGLIRYTFRVE